MNRGAFPQQQTQQGSGGIFGQSNANANGGAFGQQQGTGALFGAKPASGGLFGQSAGSKAFGMNTNPTGTTGGLFGQTNQQQSGGGLFGQQQNSNAGGLFGQNNQSQNQSGLFGQQNSSNAFGQPQQQGGLFGSKPAGGLFGQQQGASTLRLVMPKIILYLGKITNNSNQPGDYSDNKTTSRSPNLVDCLARPIKIIISHLAKMGYNNHNRIIVFSERNQLVLEIQAYSLTAQQIKVTV